MGTIVGAELRELGAVRKGYTYFAEHDVIFARITPCMENGKSAVARALQNGIGFGSTEFHVLRPGPALVPEMGIRSFGNGTFPKPRLTGAQLGKKRVYWIHTGDLVFNNVFAW